MAAVSIATRQLQLRSLASERDAGVDHALETETEIVIGNGTTEVRETIVEGMMKWTVIVIETVTGIEGEVIETAIGIEERIIVVEATETAVIGTVAIVTEIATETVTEIGTGIGTEIDGTIVMIVHLGANAAALEIETLPVNLVELHLRQALETSANAWCA